MVSVYYDVPGKDLIESETPSLKRMIDVTYSLLTSLSILHSLNIAHRDIKPENIIYNPKAPPASRVVLIDFDFSCRSRDPNLCVFKPGTLEYAASSLHTDIQIDGELWKRCDIVSVGLTIYRLLFYDFDTSLKDLLRRKPRYEGTPMRTELSKFLFTLMRADIDYHVHLKEIIAQFYSLFSKHISPEIKKDYNLQMRYYGSL
jgi:serine/threonine protein kinase